MLLEIALALVLGIIAGTITGLIPGIHINLVSTFLVVYLGFFLSFTQPLPLIIFIVSMSITHIFIDFIPSIYLGAPEESSSLAVMPGHKLLIEGKGHEAVLLSIIGVFLGAIISIILTPIIIILLPTIYPWMQRMMAWILLWGVVLLISKESNSKIWALIIFILSGFLGLATFNLPIKQPLLPLLSGLFGASTLIYSIKQKTEIPEQQTSKINIDKKSMIKPLISSTLISPICAFLPGLGSSQAAILSSSLFKITQKQFLLIIGAVNSIVMILSFVAVYSINKSRTGSAAAISQITEISKTDLFYILVTIAITASLAFFLAKNISKTFAKNINKINYSKISIAILITITIAVIFFSGFLGFIIFLISTMIGFFAILMDVRKGHLMGCLLIPTILYYLPFF